MKRGLIVGLVVVLIVAAILGFRIFSQRPSETGQIPVAVQPALQSGGRATAVVTEEPQFQHIEEILKLHGKLEAARRVDVIPKAAGQITAVYHSVGDRVNRGDLLVQLETEGLELQLQQAEGSPGGRPGQSPKDRGGSPSRRNRTGRSCSGTGPGQPGQRSAGICPE